MPTLYIIGNGFDRYHGLDTRYQAFSFFLQDKYSRIHDFLVEYYGLPYLDKDDIESQNDPLWAEFEKALADFNYENVLEENSELLPDPGNPEFRDSDWDTFKIEMEEIVRDLTKNLFAEFKEFILSVKFPENIDDKKLKLDKDAEYLNFNYTDTLERYYEIPGDRILYIHNKAKNKSDILILGHGSDPEKFGDRDDDKPDPPEGLTEEELYQWEQDRSDEFPQFYEAGKSELLSYFEKSFKQTSRIIEENSAFFNRIRNVDTVIVLGHSLSEVDHPYIDKVFHSVLSTASWTASYYRDDEREARRIKLIDLGVLDHRAHTMSLSDLKLKN